MEQEISGLKVCRQLLLLQTLIQIRPQVVIFTGLLQRCKQWGNLWAGYTEVLNWYFPLTTSQVYAVCLTKHTKNISSGHNWEPARIEEWNNSYARIHPDGDLGYSVIAICKAQQQWGTNTIGSRTTRTEAYPLPYSEFCLPIVSGKGYVGGLNYGFGVGVTNFGLTSVTIANNSEDSSYRWTGYTYIVVGAQPQWGFSVTLSFESQLYYQHYPISFTVGPFTNILTTVSDEVNGVVYAPTTVNWYKDKFGIVCDYYSNGAYVKPTSVTFISLGI